MASDDGGGRPCFLLVVAGALADAAEPLASFFAGVETALAEVLPGGPHPRPLSYEEKGARGHGQPPLWSPQSLPS